MFIFSSQKKKKTFREIPLNVRLRDSVSVYGLWIIEHEQMDFVYRGGSRLSEFSSGFSRKRWKTFENANQRVLGKKLFAPIANSNSIFFCFLIGSRGLIEIWYWTLNVLIYMKICTQNHVSDGPMNYLWDIILRVQLLQLKRFLYSLCAQ
jgi:hypothetical protein